MVYNANTIYTTQIPKKLQFLCYAIFYTTAFVVAKVYNPCFFFSQDKLMHEIHIKLKHLNMLCGKDPLTCKKKKLPWVQYFGKIPYKIQYTFKYTFNCGG